MTCPAAPFVDGVYLTLTCAEYFLKESQIKLFRQALLPAGGIFMPL